VSTSSYEELVTYQELLAQRAVLDDQLEMAHRAEVEIVVGDIRKQMQDYGLTIADLIEGGQSKTRAKYRDPVSGSTWGGRGRRPLWLKRGSEKKYLIR
jgi:DNA-binding protein H-NS